MKNFTLPVNNYKNEIVKAFEENNTLIVKAETGSGKSTMIPQFIADLGYNVIVTEPRIIAATSLAKTVAKMYNKNDKNLVSYHTSESSNVNKDTIITYCTDGLQVAKSIVNKNSKNNVNNSIFVDDTRKNCLIIDEVHEWNLNIETLVAYVKYIRDNHINDDLKVILMSATIDTTSLEEYFNAKTLEIPGTCYDVELEKIIPAYKYDTIERKVNDGKNILIFEAGKSEINETINYLNTTYCFNLRNDVEIIPLHGELSFEDQMKIWDDSNNKKKIIVTTNIAQTSITVPYIDVVIDMGTAKIVEVDENGIESLKIVDISQADILQRKGRAGRTKDGEYYLCSNIDFERRAKFEVPEIQRLSLDKVVLKLASIGIDAEELNFFHSVNVDNIKASKKYLRQLKALDKNYNITEIGKQMNIMPIKPNLARMIIEARKSNKKNLVGDVIACASIMDIGSLINFVKDTRFSYFCYKIDYTNFSECINDKSDIITELNIYKNIISFKYKDLKESGINLKNFTKIKKLIDKLTKIYNVYINKKYTEKDDDILKCLASGMTNNFFLYMNHDFYGNFEFKDFDRNEFNLDNKSGMSEVLDEDMEGNTMVFAIPKTIEYKDRYGIKMSKNIISMVSIASEEIVNSLFEKEEEYQFENATYDVITKEIRFTKLMKIIDSEGNIINSGYIIEKINSNDSSKRDIIEKVCKLSKNIIKLNNKIYNIYYDEGNYIHIDNIDELDNIEEKDLMKNNTFIGISYNGVDYRSFDKIKEMYFYERFNNQIENDFLIKTLEVISIKLNANNVNSLSKYVSSEKLMFSNGEESGKYINYFLKENPNSDRKSNSNITLDYSITSENISSRLDIINEKALLSLMKNLIESKYYKRIHNTKMSLTKLINKTKSELNYDIITLSNFKEVYENVINNVKGY